MMQDISRMETMIDSALTYLKEGRAEQRRVKIDLPSLLETICDHFSDVGANIECVVEDSAYVFAEEDSLVRATENLIQNGLRHAKKVRLSLTRPGEKEIAIQIDDDGPGIPGDQRAGLLKPFVNGVDVVTSKEQNYGLGLSIADAIAHAHGGRLDLDDSKMGGLCVHIILPVSDSSAST
jgi:signal transduction histidine kinase